MAGWKILDDDASTPAKGWRVVDESSSIAPAVTEPSLAQRGLDAAKTVAGKVADTVGTMIPGVAVAKALYNYDPETATGMMRAAASGATFNASERAEAAVRAATGDKSYDDNLEQIRKEQEAFREDSPVLAMGSELAGGIAMPGGAVIKGGKYVADVTRGALRAGGASRRVANAVGTTAGSVAAGGAFGGAAGAGNTKDFTDVGQVASDVGWGTGTGAVLGPALERGANLVWGGAKAAGRFVDDAGRRVYEAVGGDASTSATRLLADAVEDKGVALLPGQRRGRAGTGAAGLDQEVANAAVPGVQNSLAIANPRVAALAEELGAERWMPNAPYEQFARRNLFNQTSRVSQGVADTLNGAPVDHRTFMDALETGATRAQDATYARIRQGQIGGGTGNMRVSNLRAVVDENPALARHLQEALDQTVADPSVAFTRADAERILDGDFLRTDNMHPAVVERLYSNLTSATHSGDGVARGLLTQLQNRLGQTTKGRAMLDVKERHANAFAKRDAAHEGEAIWGKQGASRDAAMRARNNNPNAEARDAFREAAAGGAGQRIAGDQGTFARPQNLVGSPENRATMEELFGAPNTQRAQSLIEREGNVHDVSRRMFEARTNGNSMPPDAIANALKMAVQWKFTPSVAIMNTWSRVMRGVTKPRGAAAADIALNQGDQGIARVRAELARRDAIRQRAPETARRAGAYSQLLAEQLGVYGSQ